MIMVRSDALSLGQKIRDLRKRLHLTQSQLAGDTFTKSFISQIEKGLTTPSIKSLSIIAQRLGVPVSYLVSDESVPYSHQSNEYLADLQAARKFHQEKRYAEAVRRYEKALSNIPSAYHDLIAGMHYSLAEIYSERSQYSDALEHAQVAIEHLKLAQNDYMLAQVYNMVGHLYSEQRDFARATSSFLAGIDSLNKSSAGDVSLRVRLMVNLGISYGHAQHYQQSIEVLTQAIQIMNETDEYYNFGKACQTLGYAYAKLGDIDRAVELTRKAFDLYTMIGHTDLAMSARINLSVFLRMKGELREAKQLLAVVVEESTSKVYRALAHAELAHIAMAQGEYDQVIEGVRRAFELAPEHTEIPEWLELLAQVGEVCPVPREMVDELAGLVSHWKADERALAEAHSSLGALYKQLGEMEKANHHLSQSVSLFKKGSTA